MAAEQRMTRQEEFLKKRDLFRRNAFLIIKEMVVLSKPPPDPLIFLLVDQIFHSIFFLGKISIPPFSPNDIVTDEEMLEILRGCYPQPFERYSSQLPKRSPISCVLDMIVNLMGQKDEDKIKQSLQELINKAKAAEHKRKSQEEFLKKAALFKWNSFLIIKEMVALSEPPPHPPSVLVDEILHSIFFLGKINTPSYSPEDIVTHDEMLHELKGRYPLPFELYSSQLPKRSPMSCVLDMIVDVIGQRDEDEIKQVMQELILKLKQCGTNHMISSTICVSQVKDSVRYYGVSMSTSGPVPGKIIIAASCLSSWDSYVAGAVMTYYPKKQKKPYFDGTIKLPKQVRCQAFSLNNGKKMDPCKSCENLFGLTPKERKETKEWVYGNCAEAESVSNLLKNEDGVREKVRLRSKKCKNENRQWAKESVLEELQSLLNMVKFKWDNKFYPHKDFDL